MGPGVECDGCLCPILDASNFLREEVETEINRKLGGFGEWSYEKLQNLYSAVAMMLDDNKGRINRKWDATLAGLARIVKSERSRARFIELWNLKQSK